MQGPPENCNAVVTKAEAEGTSAEDPYLKRKEDERMTQRVPLNKQSKKMQRAYHAKQRGSWYGLSPVTRTVPSRKAYDRNKAKQSARRDPDGH